MATDPCAFNFVYTNYADSKALFANFQHLEQHLNKIGCGGGAVSCITFIGGDYEAVGVFDVETGNGAANGIFDWTTVVDPDSLVVATGASVQFIPGNYIITTSVDVYVEATNDTIEQAIWGMGYYGMTVHNSQQYIVASSRHSVVTYTTMYSTPSSGISTDYWETWGSILSSGVYTDLYTSASATLQVVRLGDECTPWPGTSGS